MAVCAPDWCLQSPEEGTGFLRTGVTDGSKPLCGCWESNLGPLQEPGLFFFFKKKKAVKKSGILYDICRKNRWSKRRLREISKTQKDK